MHTGTHTFQSVCLPCSGALVRESGERSRCGTYFRYRFNRELFRRSTSNAEQYRINECQFADDAALLANTRSGVEKAAQSYVDVASAFGLTVSITKTKFLVSGHDVQGSDKTPINLPEGSIENVDEFPYLGSLVASNGKVDAEVNKRIANASKAFGALRGAVFKDKNLTITTKRKVYQAFVLSVLL